MNSIPERKCCCTRQLRWCVLSVLAASLAISGARPADALDVSESIFGANHGKAHAKSKGKDVPIGILEVGGGWDVATTTLTAGVQLIRSRNFTGLTTPLAADPGTLADPSAHASLVSEIISSPDADYKGVAPEAKQYIAQIDTPNSIRSAIDWYTREYGVGLYNFSWGGVSLGTVSSKPQNEGEFTLNAVGDSYDLVTDANRFDFSTLSNSAHRISVIIEVDDGDTATGDFDNSNLLVAITTGVGDASPLFLAAFFDGLPNGTTGTSTASVDLTPAQQTTLAAKIAAAPNGKIGARIVRLSDQPDADPGDGNTMTLTDADVSIALLQRNNEGLRDNTLAFDWYAKKKDVLFVVAAGNEGTTSRQILDPSDLYNGLTVGAMDSNFIARASFSSYWVNGEDGTNADSRKPDLLAPGASITAKNVPSNNGTSFAAPHVTGAAALVSERGGLTLGDGSGSDHLAIKSILMNSARKRFINEPEGELAVSMDHSATGAEYSDYDYLKDGVIRKTEFDAKTRDWTPSDWSITPAGFLSNRDVINISSPLDDEQGTGYLDAERALIQVDAGEQGPGVVDKIGWDVASVAAGAMNTYTIGGQLRLGSFITATLVWDRLVSVATEGDRADELDAADVFAFDSLSQLILELSFDGDLIAHSFSSSDSVQHLHIPVEYAGDPGDYSIVVKSLDDTAFTYGLAWWSVPEPSTGALAIFVLALIFRRTRGQATSFDK